MQLYPDRLQVSELVDGVERLVAAEAGLLEAAERRGDVAAVEAVDPDRAGPEAAGGLHGLVDVGGPDRRRQAVDRVVGDPDRLVLVGEGEGGEHRAEDLLSGDRSEEHTSELQSLMRISYAVFCLKKKNI